MPIRILSPADYLKYSEKINEGVNETTHIALVNLTGKPTRCVVKLYPESSRGIYNEMIGYCLAKALSIPQPDHAAFIAMPTSALPNKPDWINGDYWGAWCTEYIPKKTIKPWYNSMKGLVENPPDKKTKKALNKISSDLNKWVHSSRTAAFDLWAGNQDRNLGNLIRMGSGKYKVIDHGQLIGNTAWHIKQPDVHHQWRNILKELLQRNKEEIYILSGMVSASDNHRSALAEVIEPVLSLLDDDLDQPSKDFVRLFFSSRAEPSTFKKMCGVML